MAKPVKKWPFRFVEVVWRDIVSCASWRSATKPPKTVEVHHRGWLIHEDDDTVTIAGSLTERDREDSPDPNDTIDMGDSHSIPRGCIQSIRQLKGVT